VSRSDSEGTAQPVLAATDVSSGYGSTPVITGINIHVMPGEVVAVLGANGAGKSTTLFTLAGVLPVKKGRVELFGEAVTGPLHQRSRAGLGFVPEGRSVVAGLSVQDNLRLASKQHASVLELFPELKPLMKRKAGQLSGGEQQILSLARCLCREPRVILVDEISLGLAPQVTTRVLDALIGVAHQMSVGVVLVEQHIHAALASSARAYILQRGKVVLEGDSPDLLDRIDDIKEAYISTAERPD